MVIALRMDTGDNSYNNDNTTRRRYLHPLGNLIAEHSKHMKEQRKSLNKFTNDIIALIETIEKQGEEEKRMYEDLWGINAKEDTKETEDKDKSVAEKILTTTTMTTTKSTTKSPQRNPNDGQDDSKFDDEEHQQTMTTTRPTKKPTKSTTITITKNVSTIHASKRNYEDF